MPEKEDRKTRSEAAELLERDFKKAKEKGYSPKELSQMLKNEGIIIPAYLIKRFFTENGNIPVTQKQEAISAKKQTPQKTAFIVLDTLDKKIWYEHAIFLWKQHYKRNVALPLIGYLTDDEKQVVLLQWP